MSSRHSHCPVDIANVRLESRTFGRNPKRSLRPPIVQTPGPTGTANAPVPGTWLYIEIYVCMKIHNEFHIVIRILIHIKLRIQVHIKIDIQTHMKIYIGIHFQIVYSIPFFWDLHRACPSLIDLSLAPLAAIANPSHILRWPL